MELCSRLTCVLITCKLISEILSKTLTVFELFGKLENFDSYWVSQKNQLISMCRII